MHLIMPELSCGRRLALQHHQHTLPVGTACFGHLAVQELVCILYIDARHLHAAYGPGEAPVFGTHLSQQLTAGLLYLGQPLVVIESLASRGAVELLKQGRALQEFAIVLGDLRHGAFVLSDRKAWIPDVYGVNTTELLDIS